MNQDQRPSAPAWSGRARPSRRVCPKRWPSPRQRCHRQVAPAPLVAPEAVSAPVEAARSPVPPLPSRCLLRCRSSQEAAAPAAVPESARPAAATKSRPLPKAAAPRATKASARQGRPRGKGRGGQTGCPGRRTGGADRRQKAKPPSR